MVNGNLQSEPLEYSTMPALWTAWAMRRVHDARDMRTLAENGIRFFDTDVSDTADVADWDKVTVAGVDADG